MGALPLDCPPPREHLVPYGAPRTRRKATLMNDDTSIKTVCVTGAAGFIGTHVVRVLLERGYRVHATVRDAADGAKVSHLLRLVPEAAERLALFSADLTREGAFDAPLRGCSGLFHVASPVKMAARDPWTAIVKPAVDGTTSVLDSAARAGTVERIVFTSSIAAIMGFDKPDDYIFTEEDWCEDADLHIHPYPLSKSLAEKAAWRAVENWPGTRPGLVTINPSYVFGPVYTRAHMQSSIEILRRVLCRDPGACPRLHYDIADVREVADAHVNAFERPEATGRYLLTHDQLWWREIADLLRERYPERRLPRRTMPDWMVLIVALLSRGLSFRATRRELGRVWRFESRRAERELGIVYRPVRETIIDAAESLIGGGLV